MMEKNEDSREIKTVYMAPPPEWYPLQQQHEDEVDLVTIFGALWRRRRLIVLFAIIAAVLAAGYVNVLVSPKYQVKALVSPGIMGLDDNGVPVYSASFARMAIWLEQGGYVSDLTSQLPPDAVENGMIPGPGSIEAEFPKGGQFLRIVLNTADPEEGEQILVKILDIMKEKETSHEVVKSRMENEIKDMEEVLASWHLKEEDLAALLEKIRRDIASLKSSVKDLEQEIPLDEKYVDQMSEKIASINEDLRKKINQLDDVTEADKTEAFINAYAGVLEQNINYAVQMTERLDMLQAALEKKKWAYEDKINKIQEQKVARFAIPACATGPPGDCSITGSTGDACGSSENENHCAGPGDGIVRRDNHRRCDGILHSKQRPPELGLVRTFYVSTRTSCHQWFVCGRIQCIAQCAGDSFVAGR